LLISFRDACLRRCPCSLRRAKALSQLKSSCICSRRLSNSASDRLCVAAWLGVCGTRALIMLRTISREVVPIPGNVSQCLSGIWSTSRRLGQRPLNSSNSAYLTREGTASRGKGSSEGICHPANSATCLRLVLFGEQNRAKPRRLLSGFLFQLSINPLGS
jgi:hypothetical protein